MILEVGNPNVEDGVGNSPTTKSPRFRVVSSWLSIYLGFSSCSELRKAMPGMCVWANYNDLSPPGTVTLNGGEK